MKKLFSQFILVCKSNAVTCRAVHGPLIRPLFVINKTIVLSVLFLWSCFFSSAVYAGYFFQSYSIAGTGTWESTPALAEESWCGVFGGSTYTDFICWFEGYQQYPTGTTQKYCDYGIEPNGTCQSPNNMFLSTGDFQPVDPYEPNLCLDDSKNNSSPSPYIGNPINTTDGNKTRQENDFNASGLSPLKFTRFYNSNKNNSSTIGINWSHSYNAKLTANIHTATTPYVPGDSNFSNLNTTADFACTLGWEDIKTTYNKPELASSTAVYLNNTCSIQDTNGNALGSIAVRDDSTGGVSPNPPQDSIVIERANGNTIVFTLINSVWTPPTDSDVSLTPTTSGYTLTTAQDTVEEYDLEGKLVSTTDRKGMQQVLSYNPTTGLLESVTDSLGKSLNFAYTGSNISTVTLPDNTQLVYDYDANNNFRSVKREDTTSVKMYVYENALFPNALTGIIDENGQRHMTFGYDAQGRAFTSELGDGTSFSAEKVTIGFVDDVTSTVTDALGKVRTYSFTTVNGEKKLSSLEGGPCTSCGGSSSSYTYDANGYVDSKTDFNGVVTSYVNNARGLVTTLTEAEATTEVRVTNYTWHPEYALPTCVIETSRTTSLSYTPTGSLETRSVIDTSNNTLFPTPTSKTCDAITVRGDYASLNKKVTSYMYHPEYGQLHTIDGPRTDVDDVTTLAYDTSGNLRTITNALSQVTQLNKYTLRGKPQELIDANGLKTTIVYDVRGRVDLVTVGQQVTDYDFDAVGNLDVVQRPDGSFIDYDYDAAHRLTDVRDNQGNHIHYVLDALGNIEGTEVKDSAGTLKRTSTAVYNQLSQLEKTIGAAVPAQITEYLQYDANGNLEHLRDPEGKNTLFSYDALNRLETTTNELLDNSTTVYDAHNNVISVTDYRGLETTYAYDGLGNRTQQTSPDTGITQYTSYDGAGNVLTMVDAKNQSTSYQYDILNRVDLVTYNDGTQADYIYDQGINAKGRLNSVSTLDATSAVLNSVSWGYDTYGNVNSKAENINGVTLTSAYVYNTITGQLESKTTPAGHTVSYQYSSGQVTSLSVDGNIVINNITYDPFAAANGWTWGNGQVASRNYDQDGQLDTYTLGNTTYDINYTLSGNVQSITDLTTPANDQNFNYDELHRLKDYTGSMGHEVYDYDANSNRIGLTNVITAQNDTYVIDPVSNKLTSITGITNVSYAYNANGNITNDGVHTYDYDARNRLISVDTNQAVYQLNALGQRVQKDAAGNITLFHYNEQGQLTAEADNTGAVTKEYIYFGNIPIAVLSIKPINQAVDRVVDNSDPSVLLLGNWKNSTSVAGFEGINYSSHAANSMPASSTIIDNGSAGFSVTGTWTASTSVIGFEGANYQHHFANGTSPDSVMIDNASGSSVGTWSASTSVEGFEGSNYQHHVAGTGLNTFTWVTGVTTSGDYNVYAKWTANTNRASNATYTVQHTSGNSPVTVNQQAQGGEWVLLGQFNLDATSQITLSDNANGYVIADGIMVAPIDAQPNTAHWSIAPATVGNYTVYAKWTGGGNRASNAIYTIHHAGGTTAVTQNQQTNGGQWIALGDFNLDANSAVTLTDQANGYVIADAIAITPVGAAPNQAIWQLNVGQGNYDLFAKWTSQANRASDASFNVNHVNGATSLAVNQQVEGGQWNLLGNFTFNNTSTVSLTDQANGYVIADALRVVGNVTGNEEVLHYVHTDHLGTPRVITDTNNTVVWSWHSDPFGKAAANEDPDGDGNKVTFNLRFPGQYYDAETELHYNYFRDYDPSTGRYLQSDPIGLGGGLNTYGYVGGNPLNYIDPFGLMTAQQSKELYEEAKIKLEDSIDPTGENSRCVINCFAKRELICASYRGAGIGVGLTVAGVGSVWSGGSSYAPLSRIGIFIGSQSGRIACEMLMFEKSCIRECRDKVDEKMCTIPK